MCFHSPVLNAALNGSFLEGATQTYTLDDVSEEVFGLLSEWVYTQKLEGDFGGKIVAVANLIRLWILAGKLLIPKLQNLVINLIHDAEVKYTQISTSQFKYLWEHTSSDSALRRYFVSQCVRRPLSESFRTSYEQYPVEMLAEICVQLRQNAIERGCSPTRMIDYHVKEDA